MKSPLFNLRIGFFSPIAEIMTLRPCCQNMMPKHQFMGFYKDTFAFMDYLWTFMDYCANNLIRSIFEIICVLFVTYLRLLVGLYADYLKLFEMIIGFVGLFGNYLKLLVGSFEIILTDYFADYLRLFAIFLR